MFSGDAKSLKERSTLSCIVHESIYGAVQKISLFQSATFKKNLIFKEVINSFLLNLSGKKSVGWLYLN